MCKTYVTAPILISSYALAHTWRNTYWVFKSALIVAAMPRKKWLYVTFSIGQEIQLTQGKQTLKNLSILGERRKQPACGLPVQVMWMCTAFLNYSTWIFFSPHNIPFQSPALFKQKCRNTAWGLSWQQVQSSADAAREAPSAYSSWRCASRLLIEIKKTGIFGAWIIWSYALQDGELVLIKERNIIIAPPKHPGVIQGPTQPCLQPFVCPFCSDQRARRGQANNATIATLVVK